MFGGRDLGGTILGDTWEWDPITNTWADVTPAGISPTPRRWCALAMDPVNSTVLLFGGNDAGGTYLGDTWQFDGTSWTELFPGAPLPPVRQQHILVERPDQPDVILAVGQNSGGMLKDTWTWNGSSWTEIVTANPPGASAAIDAAYDQIRGRIVFPSGMPGPTGLISEFDTATSDWIQRPLDTGIYKVTRYFLAYIPAVGKTFKVSGQALNPLAPADKTYEYQSDVVATLSTSLAGCPGGGGVPTLSVSGALWIGDSFTVDVTNVAPTEIVLLLGGLSNTIWLGVPLPLDLTGVLGNPGCLLYVAPDPILSVGLGLGPVPATYAATVPTTVAVSHVGLQFYYQAIVIDALTFQGAASDLATCVLGLK